MKTEDLPRIEELFHTALELAVAERSAYLARECTGAEELRAEVESLLASFEKRADFLEKPAFDAGLKALSADASETLTGQLIGSYRVLRLLGKGGMGEVYLAEDTRLGRLVALKFLARRLAADNWARRQLVKEAQAVAMLDHPNICAVYGLEEADGHSFIVMQYVEGEVLADLLHAGRLEAQQVLPLALQIVGALAEAHAHGIIHRDIKPRNLILTADGQLKVLDFGLAKVIQVKQGVMGSDAPSHASRNGLILGTVAYMSPEQLRAERLDFRSDIFSAGIVLYELVSGLHPFAQGTDAETIAAILTSSPLAPPKANGLARIIGKCLEKDKEQRYQSASALLLDLQSLQVGGAPRRSRQRLNPLAVVALGVLLAAGALWAYARLTAVPTLAVLPFACAGIDPQKEYLCVGLTESLAVRLSQLSQLKIKAPTRMSATIRPRGNEKQIGRELAADALLVGEVAQPGNPRVLQVSLVSVADGQQLWTASYDLEKVDILALRELVAAEVTANLRLRFGLAEQKPLKPAQPENSEALREYLRGRYYWHKRDFKNIEVAINFFKHAIDLDPTYARAYAGLADSYVQQSTVAYGQRPTKEVMTEALAAAKKALETDEDLPEGHTALGVIKLKYNWNWQEAAAEFRQAIQLNPDYATAHQWYSHLLLITGQPGAALAESEIARELDPFAPSVNLNHCRTLYWTRQHDRAARCFNELLKKESYLPAQYVLGLVYQEQGQYEQALDLLQKVHAKQESLGVAALGYAYGKLGRKEEALKLLARAEELWKQKDQPSLPSLEIAIIYVGLGERDKAFEWLEKAYQERFASLIYLTVEPLFDNLREDPRFADLARRLNLTLRPI